MGFPSVYAVVRQCRIPADATAVGTAPAPVRLARVGVTVMARIQDPGIAVSISRSVSSGVPSLSMVRSE